MLHQPPFAVPIDSRARCQSSGVGSICFLFIFASEELDDQVECLIVASFAGRGKSSLSA
jgi:hypothetical protein